MPAKMQIIIIFIFALVTFENESYANQNKCLCSDDAKEDSAEIKLVTSYKKPFIEWFSLGIGGGTHGGGGKISLFTFRMPHLVITTFQVNTFYGMPGKWGDTRKEIWAGGIMFAYPLILDKAGRHELRFGIMPEFLANFHGQKETDTSCGFVCDSYHVKNMVGFGLAPDITYVYRMTRKFSLEVSLNSHVSIAGKAACGGWFCETESSEYAWPGAFLTVGFSFGS